MLLKSYPTIITHSVSARALLCDSTTANAFIAPTGIDFTPYRGKQIEIWSGSTLWARAWVSGTAPGGENLDANLLLGLDLTTGWNKATNTTINNASTFTGVSGSNYVYKASVVTALALYKSSFACNVSAGTALLCENATAERFAVNGESNKYHTVPQSSSTAVWIYNSVPSVIEVTTATIQRVLDPAPTGALLLSSNGGSRGYAYKHASFDPNEAVTLRVLATRVFSGNGSYIR